MTDWTNKEDLTGLASMATTASNLTLSSVAATLHVSKLETVETEYDKGYNEGIAAALSIIDLYKRVLIAEQKKRSSANA